MAKITGYPTVGSQYMRGCLSRKFASVGGAEIENLHLGGGAQIENFTGTPLVGVPTKKIAIKNDYPRTRLDESYPKTQ